MQYPNGDIVPSDTQCACLEPSFILRISDDGLVNLHHGTGPIGIDEILMSVTLKIPMALFDPVRLHANIDLTDSVGPSQEAIVDLANAIGMTYGKAVELVVAPYTKVSAHETSSPDSSKIP